MVVPEGHRLRVTGIALVTAVVIVAGAESFALISRWQDPSVRQLAFPLIFGDGAILLLVAALYWFVMRRRDRLLLEMLEQVNDRQQRFAAMFENSSEIMAIYDTEGRMVRANKSAIKRLGFGAESIGQPYELQVAPEARDTTARAFGQALAGKGNEVASVFLDDAGRHVSVIANLSPIVVGDSIVGVVAAARDVTAEQEYEEQLLHNRERFRALFEQNFYAMMTIKIDGTISAINVAMERLSGYRNEELVGKSLMTVHPPALRQLAERRLAELSVTPEPMTYETSMLCKGDHEIPVEVDVLPIRVSGRIEGYYMTVKDLTWERALIGRLNEKDERVSALYRIASSASKPSLQIDEALALGMRALSMTYGVVTEIAGDSYTVRHRCGPDDELLSVGVSAAMTAAIGKRLAESPRAVAIDDAATPPWTSSIGSRILVNGSLYGALVFLHAGKRDRRFDDADVDFVDLLAELVSGGVARELAQRRLETDSLRDALTGLGNRTAFEYNVRRAIATGGRRQRKFALHFIDLDRFKPINDMWGHAAGDYVLEEVGRRLQSVVRAEDFVARVGGDEFVVLQTDLDNQSATSELSHRVTRAVGEPIDVPHCGRAQIGCSIGVAIFPEDGRTPEELLRSADVEMYRAKERSRNAV